LRTLYTIYTQNRRRSEHSRGAATPAGCHGASLRAHRTAHIHGATHWHCPTCNDVPSNKSASSSSTHMTHVTTHRPTHALQLVSRRPHRLVRQLSAQQKSDSAMPFGRRAPRAKDVAPNVPTRADAPFPQRARVHLPRRTPTVQEAFTLDLRHWSRKQVLPTCPGVSCLVSSMRRRTHGQIACRGVLCQ